MEKLQAKSVVHCVLSCVQHMDCVYVAVMEDEECWLLKDEMDVEHESEARNPIAVKYVLTPVDIVHHGHTEILDKQSPTRSLVSQSPTKTTMITQVANRSPTSVADMTMPIDKLRRCNSYFVL